jgi:GDP-mannose 6-dehydrogenase
LFGYNGSGGGDRWPRFGGSRRRRNDPMKISIFGLGYVGAVSMACLARDGHELVGVDLDKTKLELIRRGQTPIIEEGMQELMSRVVRDGRVVVTDDAAYAIQNTELSFLCVGTPCRLNGSQDLRAVERLAAQLGEAIRRKDGYHLLVVRSTVLPGTVEEFILPILEEHSGKRRGEAFDVCFQPEFLREGSSIRDYDNPPLTLVGTDSQRATAMLREVFGHLRCEFRVCSVRSAEMLKYCCNIFHALKITFANEIGRVCQAFHVDPHEVMDLVCSDTQLNISTAYLKPGFAYGGSCLPKDLRALCYAANRNDVSIPMLSAISLSNEVHIRHAADAVLETGRKSVGMIGLSFKSGTDDLRESPLVVMAERFIGKGLRLKIYDPDVHVSSLVGANRRYIEESIPHIGSVMSERLGELIDESEALVVGLKTETVVRELRARCRPDHFLLDLVNLADRENLPGTYRGVCW